MPDWLIALIGVLVVIVIILALYMIVAFRRIGITTKKLDYLVEDLSYKSEKFAPTLDSLIKLANYIETLDGILKADGSKLLGKVSQNKDDILIFINQIRDFLRSPSSKKDNESEDNELKADKPPMITSKKSSIKGVK
ncbi:hypothetical protein [[Mycoplasma] testudinis]|uniref:hypothetical protein n=1 Tax=[Mycoplasma] testudinis TaxID=33924 RepID=UPI00048000CB|nr:hypothetical protein [[Mycoplasma] testudinis]